MLNLTDIVKVTNRSGSTVIYRIPDRGIRREFYPKETKSVEFSELVAVAAQPGGRELIYNYLLIQDEDALHQSLNVDEEPEYWLTEDRIPTWMPTCTIDQFKDALKFAPEGVKELIKNYSVSLPLNDMEKRLAVKDILKFDVTLAIANNSASEIVPDEAESASKRRASTPNYKVVKKDEQKA